MGGGLGETEEEEEVGAELLGEDDDDDGADGEEKQAIVPSFTVEKVGAPRQEAARE